MFEHECPETACTVTATPVLARGTGTIRGTIVRDGEPLPGEVIQIETQAEVSDEHGAFTISPGAGVHELTIYGPDGAYATKPRVVLGRRQDAEVAIAITCHCCEP
ncbi:MAG TPA: hypothetical protein VLT45_21420 [Kofleriaceae bacterium]|nr:hypothetical protein [Kofleriaceae bacterium]